MNQRTTRSHHRLVGAAAFNPALRALIHELRRSLKGCATILDVGCGELSPLRFVHGVYRVGLDGYAPALERARQQGTHDEYVLGDVKGISPLFPNRRFDACVALDVIEHLPKDEGWRMLEAMERLATQCVVIFTPNGFVPQHSKAGDLQEHLSGWMPGELRARGYTVLGMHGPKSLRGEYATLKRQPKIVWGLVSVLAHYLYTRQRPEKAFSIFCHKRMDGN